MDRNKRAIHKPTLTPKYLVRHLILFLPPQTYLQETAETTLPLNQHVLSSFGALKVVYNETRGGSTYFLFRLK
jgi:hypothetical protein